MQDQWGRREFLRAGLGGFGALSLPGLLRLRAEAALKADQNHQSQKNLVLLNGIH